MPTIKALLDFNQLPSQIINNQQKWKRFILVCFLIRLLFFVSDGHNSDFDFFEHWGDRIVNHGFTNIYSLQVDRFECDYPPLYLYVIAPLAYAFDFLNLDMHTHLYDNFLKLFNLIVELLFLFYVYKKINNKIFISVLIFSPVSILNAYGWGQIDILYTILMFIAFYNIYQKKLYVAAISIGLSLSLKTQTILFLPLLGLMYLLINASLKEKILSLILLILVYILPNLPFILYAPNALDSINPHITAAGRYNNISVNAFNFYWAIWADFDLKMDLKFPPNDVLVFNLISRKLLAYTLFSIVFIWIIYHYIRHLKNEKLVFLLISFFCFSFFILLPEMHERYLFPMFFFSAYVLSKDSKEWPYFLIITVLHLCNLLWGWGENKFVKDQWIFESTRIFALLTGITYLFYFKRVREALKSVEA